MKFIFKEKTGAQFFEFGRARKVENVKIEINDIVYDVNEDVEIMPGQYMAQVLVYYNAKEYEVIKNQKLNVSNKDIVVSLDMKGFHYRLANALINIRFLYVIIASVIIAIFAPELGLVLATGFGLGVFYSGNDFVYKKLGFDKTFRAKFRKKII